MLVRKASILIVLVFVGAVAAGGASGPPSALTWASATPAAGADLTIRTVSNPPVSIRRGGDFRSSVAVANVGTRTAGRSSLRMYVSRDARWSRNDIPLTAIDAVARLGAGGAARRTVVVRIPATVPLGRWYLIACADFARAVRERNEANNCRRSGRRVAVVGRPGGLPVLTPVDGGPDYYRRFGNGLPTTRSYFPIAVWFESVVEQSDVTMDKNAGLNTYVVLTSNSNLALLRANGMKAFLQEDEWRSSTEPGTETAGWVVSDEIDMQRSPGDGFAELDRIRRGLPADGRARWTNYGKGVAFWLDDPDAARYVNQFQDIVSSDVYWFTDNNVCDVSEGGALLAGRAKALTEAECHRAANYGAQVRRVRGLVRPRGSKPVWAFVELGHPFAEDWWPTITPQQVRAAVWHSIIAGARGITYFNHSFAGSCTTQHILRDPCYAGVRAMVTSVNRQIRTLAPVLNGPVLTAGFRVSGSTRAMAKWSGGHFYVFAGSAQNAESIGSFAIPCVGKATATVVGEGRAIPVEGGAFSDTFADGNAVHIYRIDGGSTCGLRNG